MSLLPKQKCFDCTIHSQLESENRSLQVEVHNLQQNQAKLIEALKPFADKSDDIYYGWDNNIKNYLRKASQTMKEVCGGSD